MTYVKVQTMINDEVKTIEHYYIIDYKKDIETLEKIIRFQWDIKCSLYWRLDVIMDEDYSRNREKNSIHNLATFRKIIFNLTSLDNSFGKIPLKRKIIQYVFDFKNIEKFIFEIITQVTY